MATVALAGATGLTGSNILKTLCNVNGVSSVHAFTRRELPAHDKLQSIVASDSSSWAGQYPSGIQLFFSGIGTTKANAGSLEGQRKIDYDLNLELAKAAKASGTKTYVLISTTGASSSSMFPYLKMKGELEDAVKKLDFDHTVFVRPGTIVGSRNETRTAEAIVRKTASFVGSCLGNWAKDPWAQDVEIIAKAAVKAGLDCVEGRSSEKVKVVSQTEIVRLGRTEWKD